jgi:hypothetical protein
MISQEKVPIGNDIKLGKMYEKPSQCERPGDEEYVSCSRLSTSFLTESNIKPKWNRKGKLYVWSTNMVRNAVEKHGKWVTLADFSA